MPETTRPTRPERRTALRRCSLVAVSFLFFPANPSAAETTLTASYTISVAGLTIGKANATSRFNRTGYAAVIKGATSGISRLVSDARATLLGSGYIVGKRVLPASYTLETSERDFETHVRMSMQAGAVTDLLAIPRLRETADRVPLGPDDKRNVVDPVGAFLIVTDKPGLPDGETVCARTLRVFDGWQRFDVALAFKETRDIHGGGEAYDGKVVVCKARYVPVAGHRESLESTRYMTENKRLEVWYAPIGNLPLLAPYRIIIGTRFGDLAVTASSFVTSVAPAVGN